MSDDQQPVRPPEQQPQPPSFGKDAAPLPGHYAPPPAFPPSPGYQQPGPAVPIRRSPLGTVIALVGFGTLVAGLFALPLNSYDIRFSPKVGFVETRMNADLTGTRSVGRGDPAYSALAEFWWLWGAYIACAALLVLICVAVAARTARAAGWAMAVVAVAGGVIHGVAMGQSTDAISLQQLGRGGESNFYDHDGAGIWVSLAGFLILAIAGLVVALTAPRRTPPAAPWQPPPSPAGHRR